MKAKYKSKCSACEDTISVGEEIVYVGSSILHAGCQEEEQDEVISPVIYKAPLKDSYGIIPESIDASFGQNIDEDARLRVLEYIMQEDPSYDNKLYLDDKGITLTALLKSSGPIIMGRSWNCSHIRDLRTKYGRIL